MIRDFNGKTPKIAESAFVSETAYVVGDVEIGEGSSVWPCAVIRGDFGKIRIGSNTAIEDNCVIHSGTPSSLVGDVFIGDRVLIGHGAALNGRKIGNDVLIGMNATILHDTEVGNSCIIGAGSMVAQGMKIPDNSLVMGIPAKITGNPSQQQLILAREGFEVYAELAKQYKDQGL
jgi:carbonic anhydrase/acetyltransferase-like protein (isoleucine patch superfamily)